MPSICAHQKQKSYSLEKITFFYFPNHPVKSKTGSIQNVHFNVRHPVRKKMVIMPSIFDHD